MPTQFEHYVPPAGYGSQEHQLQTTQDILDAYSSLVLPGFIPQVVRKVSGVRLRFPGPGDVAFPEDDPYVAYEASRLQSLSNKERFDVEHAEVEASIPYSVWAANKDRIALYNAQYLLDNPPIGSVSFNVMPGYERRASADAEWFALVAKSRGAGEVPVAGARYQRPQIKRPVRPGRKFPGIQRRTYGGGFQGNSSGVKVLSNVVWSPTQRPGFYPARSGNGFVKRRTY